MNKKRLVFIIIGIIIISITVLLLYLYNSILHKQYTNADFKIETYVSNIDKDDDGIDDQTDILNNVRNYISKIYIKISYSSKVNIFINSFNVVFFSVIMNIFVY